MAYINGLKIFFGGIPCIDGVKWAGLYSDSMLYSKGSIVVYQGSVYIKVSTAAAGTLPIDASAWKFLGKAVSGKDSPLPIEVSTEAEMTALLTSGEIGGVYKYTGTTGTYENGALYVLEVCE